MNEQHNGQKPEAPADRSSLLPDWCQSMPLYRLLVFISMFTVWSQLRIPAFFRPRHRRTAPSDMAMAWRSLPVHRTVCLSHRHPGQRQEHLPRLAADSHWRAGPGTGHGWRPGGRSGQQCSFRRKRRHAGMRLDSQRIARPLAGTKKANSPFGPDRNRLLCSLAHRHPCWHHHVRCHCVG